MGLLDKLFGKQSKPSTAIAPVKNKLASQMDILTPHPDLLNLLWIADGQYKNYTAKTKNESFEFNGVKFVFSSFSNEEPSLMSTKIPIQMDVNPDTIDRPSYYPVYKDLTDAQRGVYWQLLQNPYAGTLNIGYVFILYYGLERHLLEGDFERAFRVILKLRDVYDNASFQSYSACALISTCLVRQRGDLAIEFYQSLDKSFELKFSDNLYLLCKTGLHLPLTAEDIIRMAKTFEFTNFNYIKKYPDLFLQAMIDTMLEELGSDELVIEKYVTASEWRKLRQQPVPIFANMSLRNKAVDVPVIADNFKLKKAANILLEKSHEKVKSQLSQMRKAGTAPVEHKAKPKAVIEIPSLDTAMEANLLKHYKSTKSDALKRHFALISLQDFYYKHRDLDTKYLQMCINFCNEDIELLPSVQSQYKVDEQKRILGMSSIYNKKELAQMLANISTFNGTVPAFKRLAIIYDKSKDYILAIDICSQAISYYDEIGLVNESTDFIQRRSKLESKLAKL